MFPAMSDSIEADEVLPPSSSPTAGIKPPGKTEEERHASAKIIARWLDELIPLPGTKFKIGLDPLIAFVPGIGDFLSSSVSAVVLLESIRKGVSASVIGRMALNVGVNSLMDTIPVIGPFFSAFFKSNSRNLELLHRWEQGEHKELRQGSRWVLMALVLVIFLCFAAVMMVWAFYLLSLIASVWKLSGFLGG